MMADEHPARLASQRSMKAVQAKTKNAWLDLFTNDAIIEDPVGVSPLDSTGKGQIGKAAISAFWDTHIGPNTVVFDIAHSYAAGNEVANVGKITTTLPNGMKAVAEGVFVYRVNGTGKIVSLRAFWEFDKMLASMMPPA
ncbi:MAG: nuclear transport factor 2 family protein [Candidatus Binatia bacterium]